LGTINLIEDINYYLFSINNIQRGRVIMGTLRKNLLTLWFSFFLFSGIIIQSMESAHAGAIKWYPGHYYTILPGDIPNTSWREEQMEKIYAELAATPVLRGLQVRLTWDQLEGNRGVYTFGIIDKMLTRLTDLNKRLVVQVKLRGFAQDETIVPNYMKTAEFEGGFFKYGDYCGKNCIPKNWSGNGLRLWNANVKTRLLALMKALGNKYNSKPNFQGIGFIETAFGVPMADQGVTINSPKYYQWFENSLEVNRQTRLFFPNTMVMQETNFPIDMIKDYIQDNANSLVNNGIALSCPDTFELDEGLNRDFGDSGGPAGVFAYFKKYAGIVPIAPTVMRRNYQWTSNDFGDATGHEPTIMEILTFARDQLQSNYIFWNRVGIEKGSTNVTKDYYKLVLNTLNNAQFKNDPTGAGTLSTSCPTMYDSCDTGTSPGPSAPVVSNPLADQTMTKGFSKSFSIPVGSFTDPNGLSLTYSAKLTNNNALPAWLSFTPNTRTFIGTPPPTATNLSIAVTATNTDGLSVTDDFSITMSGTINHAPVLAIPLPDKNFKENVPFEFYIPPGSFTDPDGDTLKYKVFLMPLGTSLPGWINFNPLTKRFFGKAPLKAGNITIKVIAIDPDELKASDIFILNTIPK